MVGTIVPVWFFQYRQGDSNFIFRLTIYGRSDTLSGQSKLFLGWSSSKFCFHLFWPSGMISALEWFNLYLTWLSREDQTSRFDQNDQIDPLEVTNWTSCFHTHFDPLERSNQLSGIIKLSILFLPILEWSSRPSEWSKPTFWDSQVKHPILTHVDPMIKSTLDLQGWSSWHLVLAINK